MRKSLLAAPDDFSLSPFLSILPVLGRVGSLAPLSSSLYARYEKVQSLQEEVAAASVEAQTERRFAAEEAMLKQVLDFIAIRPKRDL